MFHIVDGRHQTLQMPASKGLQTFEADNWKSPSERDEKIDFAQMEPLNPNGYMYIFKNYISKYFFISKYFVVNFFYK